jgi:hypothetical protein
MAIPRFIKGVLKLAYDIIKGVVYLLSVGYWNLFKEDEIKIKERKLARFKRKINGAK